MIVDTITELHVAGSVHMKTVMNILRFINMISGNRFILGTMDPPKGLSFPKGIDPIPHALKGLVIAGIKISHESFVFGFAFLFVENAVLLLTQMGAPKTIRAGHTIPQEPAVMAILAILGVKKAIAFAAIDAFVANF